MYKFVKHANNLLAVFVICCFFDSCKTRSTQDSSSEFKSEFQNRKVDSPSSILSDDETLDVAIDQVVAFRSTEAQNFVMYLRCDSDSDGYDSMYDIPKALVNLGPFQLPAFIQRPNDKFIRVDGRTLNQLAKDKRCNEERNFLSIGPERSTMERWTGTKPASAYIAGVAKSRWRSGYFYGTNCKESEPCLVGIASQQDEDLWAMNVRTRIYKTGSQPPEYVAAAGPMLGSALVPQGAENGLQLKLSFLDFYLKVDPGTTIQFELVTFSEKFPKRVVLGTSSSTSYLDAQKHPVVLDVAPQKTALFFSSARESDDDDLYFSPPQFAIRVKYNWYLDTLYAGEFLFDRNSVAGTIATSADKSKLKIELVYGNDK